MPKQQDVEILKLLKRQSLFHGLNEEQLIVISNLLKANHTPSKKIVLNEGESSQQLYIILRGEVEILKWDDSQKKQFKIGKLFEGDVFGELSFADQAPRSSTVKTTRNSLLLSLDRESFDLNNPAINAIYEKILKNILDISTGRLRETNQNYVEALRKQRNQLKARNEFGNVFVIILICFGINNFFNLLLYQYHFDEASLLFNWGYIFLFLIPIIIFMIKEQVPLKTFGVTLENAGQSIKEGLIISLILTLLFIASLYIYRKTQSISPAATLEKIKQAYTNPTLIIYLFHVYAQEFIARGALQTSLMRFYNDEKGYLSIAITSFIFAIFHLHLGLFFTFLTFVTSALFGLIYNRHKNLLGVTIVHFALGTFGKVFKLF